MNEIKMFQAIDLNDKKLKNLARRAISTLKAAADKAVAHLADPSKYPLPNSNCAEKVFLKRFQQFDVAKRQAATIKVMSAVTAPQNQKVRFYGVVAGVNFQSPQPIAEQVGKFPLPDSLKIPAPDLQKLNNIPVLAGGFTQMQAMTKLQFRIRRVHCLDETNPEEFLFVNVHDTILLGGMTADDTNRVVRIGQFTVGDNFDDSDQVTYNPPRVFKEFSLVASNRWPKFYHVALVLAEEDMGGYSDYLTELEAKAREEVDRLVKEATAGVDSDFLDALINCAVKYTVDKVIGWLRAWWEDDVFPPLTVTIGIPSQAHRFPSGATASPEQIATFVGHQGTYQVAYDWRLAA